MITSSTLKFWDSETLRSRPRFKPCLEVQATSNIVMECTTFFTGFPWISKKTKRKPCWIHIRKRTQKVFHAWRCWKIRKVESLRGKRKKYQVPKKVIPVFQGTSHFSGPVIPFQQVFGCLGLSIGDIFEMVLKLDMLGCTVTSTFGKMFCLRFEHVCLIN